MVWEQSLASILPPGFIFFKDRCQWSSEAVSLSYKCLQFAFSNWKPGGVCARFFLKPTPGWATFQQVKRIKKCFSNNFFRPWPLAFVRHFNHLDPAKHGMPPYLYMNMVSILLCVQFNMLGVQWMHFKGEHVSSKVRDPVDRIISDFHYRRSGAYLVEIKEKNPEVLSTILISTRKNISILAWCSLWLLVLVLNTAIGFIKMFRRPGQTLVTWGETLKAVS